MGEHVGLRDVALPLGRAALAQCQQGGKPAIGGDICGQAQQAGPVGQIETRADDEAQIIFVVPDLAPGPYDAGERVAVGQRDGAVAQLRRLADQLIGMRGPAQEAEIAGDLQFGVVGRGAPAA
jgi:hypothetical protein